MDGEKGNEGRDGVLPMSRATFGVAPPGHRLSAETRLGPVRLQIADLERSLVFYTHVLGLGFREIGPGRAALIATGGRETLVELYERPGARPVPKRGRLGMFHYALLLPDRAALGRFASHAAGLGVPPGAADHLVSEALYLDDPDGHGIEVYADRARSRWRSSREQVLMTTEPLDMAGLRQAGEPTGFDGLPAGTVIGHVHLHVGDLGHASSFYHEALGFDRVNWGYPGALFLSAGGYHHHLGTNTWAGRASPPGPDDARLLSWTLVLPTRTDVERALASLRSAGYTVSRTGEGAVDEGGDPADRGGGGHVSAEDPWGTRVEFVSREGVGAA